jgi:dTDP-4-amino-4,6-dideoxygalactose transaminase
MKKKIWLSSPHMGGGEMKYIQEAFDSNWIAPLGPNLEGFEHDLVSYTGAGHAAALSSGTGAIHLALTLLGVQPGDEVIASSFTFSATINPITYLGALPILVDSEPTTWNMCPALLEQAIKDRIKKGKKPRAIIPVYLYGMPAKIDEIMEIAMHYGIPVVEDAAEALGSKYRGKSVGTFGRMGVLSFNGNKIITTSGGGALVSDDEELIRRARFLATQARDPAPHYQHSEIGYNYRMSNIVAGIGRGQMEVLERHISQRRKNFTHYREQLSAFEGISFLEEPDERFFSNHWLTCMLVDPRKTRGITREQLRLALEQENIEARPLWKPMHMQPVFQGCPFYGNGTADKLFDEGLCMPSGSNLDNDDRKRITETIRYVLKQ